MVKQYGNWCKTKGTLEDMPKGLVDEIIDMMYEQATEELAADGIVIAKHTVEWHVTRWMMTM